MSCTEIIPYPCTDSLDDGILNLHYITSKTFIIWTSLGIFLHRIITEPQPLVENLGDSINRTVIEKLSNSFLIHLRVDLDLPQYYLNVSLLKDQRLI